MNIGQKVWGTTTPLILMPSFEMHRLHIMPWHVCSKHEHQFKHNAFLVLQGELWIDTWFDNRHEDTFLSERATFTVAPGVLHRFRTGREPCWALEVYFPNPLGPPLTEDIIRMDTGHEIVANA